MLLEPTVLITVKAPLSTHHGFARLDTVLGSTRVPANQLPMRFIKLEIFNRPAMNAAIQVVLFLYAYSRTTSIVIVGRHRGAHLLPTLEGYALLFDFLQVRLAGNDLTENLIKILFERDLSPSPLLLGMASSPSRRIS
ncbi:unnamed protein product [Polarella glacialis]|uniref:Uncharacterized protein n=1 Tax=Polarella glacialis TaxID=89957 RepID=A0A813FKA5_POLGL|nr:unnamed protein product [Polarella glacialis]